MNPDENLWWKDDRTGRISRRPSKYDYDPDGYRNRWLAEEEWDEMQGRPYIPSQESDQAEDLRVDPEDLNHNELLRRCRYLHRTLIMEKELARTQQAALGQLIDDGDIELSQVRHEYGDTMVALDAANDRVSQLKTQFDDLEELFNNSPAAYAHQLKDDLAEAQERAEECSGEVSALEAQIEKGIKYAQNDMSISPDQFMRLVNILRGISA